MLFESPFYVDYPVTLAVLLGASGLISLWLLVVFKKRGAFHDMVVDYFHRRRPGVPMEKWSTLGEILLVVFTIMFGGMGLYAGSVATGIVKNKDKDNSVSPEQLERLKIMFDKQRPRGEKQ